MHLLSVVALALAATSSLTAQTYTISTFAGGALPVNILGTSARVLQPSLAVDATGNVYFTSGNSVLRMDAATGLLSLVAGTGNYGFSGDNGPATGAELASPGGVAVDSSGNVYIADTYANRVRKVSNGIITTVAGNGDPSFGGDSGAATSASLYLPAGVAVDSAGNVYIADSGNYRIRKVSNGIITTVAGNGVAGFSGDNGPATSAQLSSFVGPPYGISGIAVDAAGNLYIADIGNQRIRIVSNGVITTLAGNGGQGFRGDNGPATSAELDRPQSVTVDSAGNVYIGDMENARTRKVSKGVITTVAGNGTFGFSGDNGLATAAELGLPSSVAADSAGNLYTADFAGGFLEITETGITRIRKISNGVITTVAGGGTSGDNGPATGTELYNPEGVAVDSVGNLYFADTYNSLVRKVSNGVITTVAGNGNGGFSGDGGPALSAELDGPTAVAVDSTGNLYIADAGNNRVRKVSNGMITTVAGNGNGGFSGDGGSATSASFGLPYGVAVDLAGNLYIADNLDHRIRKVQNGVITTVAGNGTGGFSGDNGPATNAELNYPEGLAVDSSDNLYIADSGNFRIRKVSNGVITTVAGGGSSVQLNGGPFLATESGLANTSSVAVDSAGNLYIADRGPFSSLVHKVSTGLLTVAAGGGASFGDGGPATSAQLYPFGVAVDSAGHVYVSDTLDNRIRLLTPIPLDVTGPSSLSAGAVGIRYSAVTFAAEGGSGIYTWSATSLPGGLVLSPGGVLSGIPAVAGAFNPQFTVRDSSGSSASVSLSLTIHPAPVISRVGPLEGTPSGAVFALDVTGSGFLPGAAVEWNSTPIPTTFVSATHLTASVAASLISVGGSAGIVVVNPDGAKSGSYVFTTSFSAAPPHYPGR